MRINARGQTLIEYASIIILIMLGMVIGKTVIDRGAKAGIKNLTESVDESEKEILVQGPAGGHTLPDCNCGGWIAGPCASGSCAPTERLQTRTCAPLGCETTFGIITQQCVSDSACCTPKLLVTGNPSLDCGINATFHIPGGCPDDAGYATWNCGGTPPPPPFFACVYDYQGAPTICSFRCQNLPTCATPCYPPPGANPCIPSCTFSGDNQHLIANTNYTLISGACTSTGTRCKATCNNGLTPTPGNTCACPDPLMTAGIGCTCKCPTGYVYGGSGVCSVGDCYRGSCSNIQCANSNL